MGSINKQIARYEITAVCTHPDARVDIVLVHGLNGNPKKTWSAANDVFWPTDLLPSSLGKTRVNILVYGYNADVYTVGKSDRSASDNFIFQHAQTLVTNLALYRKSERTSGNPIIFVAHSLGGLLVKRALLYSNDVRDKNQEDARSIFISTYGIIFLGTPHTGSSLATWGVVLQRMADAIAPRKLFDSESVLLKTLKKDNETLENINNHFLDVYQRFKIHMAHENHKTDIKGTKMLVVDANSASPQLPGVTYYGIEATHSSMCKFESTSAPGYRNVSTAIREWSKEAPPVIRIRWEIELDDRRARAQYEAAERMRDYNNPSGTHAPVYAPQASPTDVASTKYHHSPSGSLREIPKPRKPLFVHPDRFRPNSFFKGREEELRDLHRMLMDPKGRSDGTSAVLIQGIPGAGKTHMARQYVFSHKDDYPGGIYWIRSTTLQDMEDGFWRIAKTEAIRGMAGQEKKRNLMNPQKMVEIVRNWFNDSDDWLLVLDGIRFGDDSLLNFIPDRPGTSLIYTSTEMCVAGDYLLDNPRVMRLGLLPTQDAQELLLEEMGKKQPYTTDDLRRAQELVQLMDRLPLMIHAAALQMNATREPLAKYLKSFRDKPKVGNLPAYKTIRDQLQDRGDTAALNLIYILSFFSQMVPVEMLALGLKALDKRTPVKTGTTGRRRSLVQTFVTLIRFALVERNEMDDIPSSSSQSSRQSDDITPEPLDVLRVHSIVQAFFIELLIEEGQLEFWLERAVRVFCLSFDEAHARMNEDPETGLPDDYRRYIIHGKKMMEHLGRHQKARSHHRIRQQTDSLADLTAARTDLEERLARLPGEIDKLQMTMSTNIIDGKESTTHSSVFERVNSLSSRSTGTSGGTKIPQNDRFTPAEDNIDYESPLVFDNPHHFHMPYRPYVGDDQGSQTEDQRSEDRTITPYPPDMVEGPYLDVAEPAWTLVSRHRSVKKREQRRYHDRGGAWRETAAMTNDPRVSVSVSRESARGLITPSQYSRGGRSPSRSRIIARSEAELELMHIKKASPPPPRGGGQIYDKGRSSSTGTVAKSLSMLGKSSYAKAVSGSAVEEETPLNPTFSTTLSRAGTIERVAAYDALSVNSLKTVDSAVHSIAHRMKENQPVTEIDPTDDPRASGPPEPQHSHEIQPARRPYYQNIFRRLTGSGIGTKRREKSRTGRTVSNSSKESLKSASPISQSTQHPPTTYKEGVRTANSSPGTQHTPFYPPGLSVVSNHSSSLQRNPAMQQNAAPSQPPYPYYPRDPYNKVLSRSDQDPYHPAVNVSSPATTVSEGPVESMPPNGYTSQPMSRNPSSNPPLVAMTGSTGTPLSSNSGSVRSSLPRQRAPSMVETEPSPRLMPMDMDQTSYNVWQQRQNGRPRDESLFGNSNMPLMLPAGRIPTFEADRESPDLGATRGSPQIISGDENLGRPCSGGIRVPDGRIIEFGDVPVDLAESGRRFLEDRDRIQRRSEEAVSLSHLVRTGGVDDSESPPNSTHVGLGIISG